MIKKITKEEAKNLLKPFQEFTTKNKSYPNMVGLHEAHLSFIFHDSKEVVVKARTGFYLVSIDEFETKNSPFDPWRLKKRVWLMVGGLGGGATHSLKKQGK